MDIARKIINSQTTDELVTLESLYVLSDYEQGLVFERKAEIMSRLAEWAIENERQGLSADLMNSWTPEERERFSIDWNDDEPFRQISDEDLFGEAFPNEFMVQAGRGQNGSNDEMDDVAGDEDLPEQTFHNESQAERGQKRAHDEMNDGASTSDEFRDYNYFTLKDTKQVRVKKFRTTGMDYTIQFMDTFAHFELSQYHDRLHEIFQSVLDFVTRDTPTTIKSVLCCNRLSSSTLSRSRLCLVNA